MVNRQIKRKKMTADAFKNAFIDLLLENRYVDAITISNITDLADYNRGTFYLHFTDKFELIEILYEDAINGFYEAIKLSYASNDKVLLNGVPPSTKLMLEHVEENKKLFKALDIIGENPDLYSRLESMFWKLFTENIHLEHEFNSTDIEYNIFLNFHLHAVLGVIKYWIQKDFIYSSSFIAEQLTSFYSTRITAMKFREFDFS